MIKFEIDFHNGMSCITAKRHIYRTIYDLVGEKLAPNGIPLAQEIEGWSELCGIGEEYITDKFTVKCIES